MFKWITCKPNILHKDETTGQIVANEGKRMVAYIYKNGKFVRVRPIIGIDKKYSAADSAKADFDIVK